MLHARILKAPAASSAAAAAAAAAAIALGSNLLLGRAWESARRSAAAPAGEAALPIATSAWKRLAANVLPAVVDQLWLRGVLDASLSDARVAGHPARYHAFMALTELDPAFFDAYFAGANLLAIVHNDGPGALELLARGERFRTEPLADPQATLREKRWRSSWAIPLLLAYVHLFELDDLEAASGAFLAAAAIPGSPAYLKSLAARLRKPGGKFEVGLRLLNFMLAGAPTEESKVTLRKKRDSLYLAQYLHDLNLELDLFAGARPRDRALWSRFRRETGTPERDPWNGTLHLDAAGRVESTTPRVPVLGLIR